MAWHGLTRPDMAWDDLNSLTWPDMAWNGLKSPNMAWNGLGWPDMAWHGLIWPGVTWQALLLEMDWHGLTWTNMAWCDLTSPMAWHGLTWPDRSDMIDVRPCQAMSCHVMPSGVIKSKKFCFMKNHLMKFFSGITIWGVLWAILLLTKLIFLRNNQQNLCN